MALIPPRSGLFPELTLPQRDAYWRELYGGALGGYYAGSDANLLLGLEYATQFTHVLARQPGDASAWLPEEPLWGLDQPLAQRWLSTGAALGGVTPGGRFPGFNLVMMSTGAVFGVLKDWVTLDGDQKRHKAAELRRNNPLLAYQLGNTNANSFFNSLLVADSSGTDTTIRQKFAIFAGDFLKDHVTERGLPHPIGGDEKAMLELSKPTTAFKILLDAETRAHERAQGLSPDIREAKYKQFLAEEGKGARSSCRCPTAL